METTSNARSSLNRKFHVAILGSRGYPSTYGGFETFIRHIAPWLANRGHEVTVYGRRMPTDDATILDGIRTVNTRGLNTKSASTVSHSITAAAHCIRFNPDAVLAVNVATSITFPILHSRNIPVVLNVDGIEWQRRKWGLLARNYFRAAAKFAAASADALVADSRAIQTMWIDRYGVEPHFIPYGAPVVRQVPVDALAALRLTPDAYVLAVARLTPENNVELLLDAMEQLGWPQDVVIVGSANYRAPIEDRLRRLHEESKVRWLGHVSDQNVLSALWAHSAVYFHGHSVGGTNPALLQALGLGAPTVALDTAFNREVIGPRGAYFTQDAQSAAEILAALLTSEPEREALRQLGLSQVATNYRWEEVCEAYERLLLEIAYPAISDTR